MPCGSQVSNCITMGFTHTFLYLCAQHHMPVPLSVLFACFKSCTLCMYTCCLACVLPLVQKDLYTDKLPSCADFSSNNTAAAAVASHDSRASHIIWTLHSQTHPTALPHNASTRTWFETHCEQPSKPRTTHFRSAQHCHYKQQSRLC